MHAVFSPQVAVSVLALDHDGGGLDARLVGLLVVHELVGEAGAFGPAGVHPIKHLRPVLGLGAARAGVDGQNDIAVVILPGQQGLKPGLLHVGLQGNKTLLQLWQEGFVLELVAHLAQGHQVVPLGLAAAVLFHLVLQIFDALLDLLGLCQVVPEAVGGGLRLEHIQLPFRALQVQGLSQLFQSGGQVVELHFVFVELEHKRPHSFFLHK